MDGGDLAAAVAAGKLEGRLYDAARGVGRNGADGDGGVAGDAAHRFFGVEGLGHLGEFDADVHAFGVLAEDDEVDAFTVIERIAGQGAAGALADVEVEQLAHADDGAAVGEAAALEFGSELAGGFGGGFRGDGAEERALGAGEQVEGALRKRVALGDPEVPADVAVVVFGVVAGGVENEAGGLGDFDADAVAGEPCDLVFGHGAIPPETQPAAGADAYLALR